MGINFHNNFPASALIVNTLATKKKKKKNNCRKKSRSGSGMYKRQSIKVKRLIPRTPLRPLKLEDVRFLKSLGLIVNKKWRQD